MCKGLIGMMENARMEERTDLVKKKLARGCSVEQIADALEQSVESIQEIIDGLRN